MGLLLTTIAAGVVWIVLLSLGVKSFDALLLGVLMVFLAATALPLLVALSAIGLSTGVMLPENAAALVGAGVLSVLVFPAAAVGIHRRLARSQGGLTDVRPQPPG